MTVKLLILAGDGIGPEVVQQAQRVAEKLVSASGLELEIEHALIGGAAIDVDRAPIAQETIEKALSADAVLLGAVGGPKWADLPFESRPEAGLLQLRSAMNVYANIRPAVCFEPLASASTLKSENVIGLDLVFVRELIGGVYFGSPRGIEQLPGGQRRGVNTQSYTSTEIQRVAHVAFRLARSRSSRICSVDKANVMESGLLWRQEVTALGENQYPDVELTHMYADNCAMQLVRDPKQFDVILTDNLFGDILSDAAAMLTGSLGMLPSAAVGEPDRPGLFEPIHGSAPDIAGSGRANPCAAILSLAMALQLSLGRPDLALVVEQAVRNALTDGYRTADLAGAGDTVGTATMGEAILERMES